MHILWNMPEQVTFQVDAMSELFRTISTCWELRCESRALTLSAPGPEGGNAQNSRWMSYSEISGFSWLHVLTWLSSNLMQTDSFSTHSEFCKVWKFILPSYCILLENGVHLSLFNSIYHLHSHPDSESQSCCSCQGGVIVPGCTEPVPCNVLRSRDCDVTAQCQGQTEAQAGFIPPIPDPWVRCWRQESCHDRD